MAVTIDAVSSPAIAENTTSASWSHTVGGSERYLVVGVPYTYGAVATVSTVTLGAQSLSLLGTRAGGQNGSQTFIELWGLLAPNTGTATITVTMTDQCLAIAPGAVSFNAVNQSAATSGYATATGTSTAPSVNISAASGDIVIDAMAAFQGPTASVGASQTERWNLVSSALLRGAGSTEPGDTTVAMSWTLGTSFDWAIGGVAVKASSVGATSPSVNDAASVTESTKLGVPMMPRIFN